MGNKTSEIQEVFGGSILNDVTISDGTQRSVQSNLPYHTRLDKSKKIKLKITKPTKVQVNPYVAQSPQDLLARNGMYRDPSLYTRNPQKIYMDLTKYEGYQELLNKSIDAKNHFNSLDVDIKAKFNHDPLAFSKYLARPDFDINEILTKDEATALQRYLDDEKSKLEYNEYLKSDEYKQLQQERELYNQFQKENYDNWKKNRK